MSWSILVGGAYRTPLGDVPVNEACAEALRARCPFLEPDEGMQRGEHAIEVVLPFLQRLAPPDLSVVPIVIGSDNSIEFAQLAEALAQVVRMYEERVLLIASSDLSHYEPQARGAEQDLALITAICTLNGPGLIRHVQDGSALMCGYGAVACVLEAAKALGASQAVLVRYGTSADAGGDPSSVIGYAGIIIE
jgi:AmmeMemoRadiSam system protein B